MSEQVNPLPYPADAAATEVPIRDVRDLMLEELEQFVVAADERAFRARQVMGWLWQRGADSFDAMSDLGTGFRAHLKNHFKISPTPSAAVARSTDGTRKLLVALGDGEAIESVIIPAGERVTLCMSSQVGCAMACEFCATARMGLHRNLTAAEILGQIVAARRELAAGEQLTNYVFMGMGEPLANYPRLARALTIMTSAWGMGISPRRITVSTVGLVPMMERLLAEFPSVNLAVSLHATTNELRDRLAPINKRYPLEAAYRRVPRPADQAARPHHLRVRDAGRGQRFARRRAAAGEAARPAAGQGEPDFLQSVPGRAVCASPRAPRSRTFKRSSSTVT